MTDNVAAAPVAAAQSPDATDDHPKHVHFDGGKETANAEGGGPTRVESAAGGNGNVLSSTDLGTEETSVDRYSNATSTDDDAPAEVIEYDPNEPLVPDDEAPDLFADIGSPTIEENTPAGEALRANANVHVSGVGKAARAINVQVVRKLVKRAIGTGRQGVVKGKPPRIPPNVELASEEDDEESQGFEAVAQEPPVLPPINEAESHDLPDHIVAGTMEAGNKVLGHVDPHGMIKLLRWRRKKKAPKKPLLKSYVKGKVIDGEHELYALSIAVMIGVRTSISKTNTLLNAGPGRRWVTQDDFRAQDKYEFRPKGGSKTPPHQLAHTFKFKDYSPVVFAYIRRLFGINEFDFLLSVCGNANFIEFISNAKSGQFFFYSSDGKYLIKTMTNSESKFLRRMLPKYFRHCAENPNTMITKFFGMYRVKMYHLRRNVKFVIMNSVYYTDKYLQTFYDLKGSWVGRDAKPGDAVKKDNDLRRGLPEQALALQPAVREKVRAQVEADLKFLEKSDVMDYSMLVGVHHIAAEDDDSIASTGFRGARPRANTAAAREGEPNGEQHLPAAASAPVTGAGAVDHATHNRDFQSTLVKQNSERRVKNDPLEGYFFDNGLNDDDSSYLMGSSNRTMLENSTSFNEDTERKKQATIENLYWPFHLLFDIHGYRRVEPATCVKCSNCPCNCPVDPILKGYNIPRFVAPLSDRKDGGFEMDTTGLKLPLKLKLPAGELTYDGKVMYMGVIDVLQEYTSRKLLESRYRMVQSRSRYKASCVPPKIYGERFLDFFDTYTQRTLPKLETVESNEIGIEMDASGDVVEYVESES